MLTPFRIAFSLSVGAWLIALSFVVQAQDFPTDSRFEFELASAPDVQFAKLIAEDGISNIDMVFDKPTKVLGATISLANPVPWNSKFTAKVTWIDGKSITIPVRIRADRKAEMQVLLSYRHASPERKTLDELDALDNDPDSTLTKYLLARDVYNGIKGEAHSTKIRALKMWFDAAYELHRKTPYFDIDTKVIELALKLETKARSEDALRKTMQEDVGINSEYFHNMRDQFISIIWADVGKIKLLSESGQAGRARAINRYFLALFANMPEEERKIIAKAQGVSTEQLQKNEVYLNQIATLQ